MKSTSSLIQLVLLSITVSIFAIYGSGFAALYGALVSLGNTWLFERYLRKQNALVDADAQKSFKMAIKSSVLRLLTLMALIIFGIGVLELESQPLIVSLVVGLIGFILDRLRQK